MQLFFVWLGSKRAAKQGVAEKGALLDVALRRGLPVPNGGILLESFYQLCLEEGVVEVVDERVTIPQSEALLELLYTAVRFPQLEAPLVIRPLFGDDNAQPNIAPTEAAQWANALASLWSAAGPRRRDVLVQEQVVERVGGTAVLGTQNESNQIWESGADSYTLPQLARWRQPAKDLPPHQQRLQKLLRGVRRTFDAAGWHVTWRDDGVVCWLMQLSPNGDD